MLYVVGNSLFQINLCNGVMCCGAGLLKEQELPLARSLNYDRLMTTTHQISSHGFFFFLILQSKVISKHIPTHKLQEGLCWKFKSTELHALLFSLPFMSFSVQLSFVNEFFFSVFSVSEISTTQVIHMMCFYTPAACPAHRIFHISLH